jgi:putative ABC transport system permease protein
LQVLGDVVLGATAARRLNLGVGDRLLSDDKRLYDISSTYPLLMRVVGVLAETGTADDLAVFVDIRTTWIIEGLGHGHQDIVQITDPGMFRQIAPGSATLTGAVLQYNEITSDNIASFHFHGGPRNLPVSAILVWPHEAKSATILLGRFRHQQDMQAVRPASVINEIMNFVLGVRRFLDAIFALVLVGNVFFLLLVMLLTNRIREREYETMRKIGCARGMILMMQFAELTWLVGMAVAVSGAMLGATMMLVVRFDLLL